MSDFAVKGLSDQFHSQASGCGAGPELSESKEKSRIGSLVVKISHYQGNTEILNIFENLQFAL